MEGTEHNNIILSYIGVRDADEARHDSQQFIDVILSPQLHHAVEDIWVT